MSDSSRRGVLESQVVYTNFWAVRFADKSRNIRATDLELLPSDAVSFEPSQAPLSSVERKASVAESSKRGMSLSRRPLTSAWICPITSITGTLGPVFAL